MTHTYTAFTYLLRFKPTGQFYYGSRTAKGCHPKDLWSVYFSSSKVVRELIAEHGVDAFEYEVRKQFDNREACLKWEHRFLVRVNARTNAKFLNRSNADGRAIAAVQGVQHRARRAASISAAKALPDALVGQFVEQYLAGVKPDAIGKALGYSGTTVRRWLVKRGVFKTKPHPGKWMDLDVAKAQELIASGVSFKKVGVALGVSDTCVRTALRLMPAEGS